MSILYGKKLFHLLPQGTSLQKAGGVISDMTSEIILDMNSEIISEIISEVRVIDKLCKRVFACVKMTPWMTYGPKSGW